MILYLWIGDLDQRHARATAAWDVAQVGQVEQTYISQKS
jgi:hypothetical protein